ncbi:MAG: hypothetical protein U0694_00605 [Anaerolineae bacterium]
MDNLRRRISHQPRSLSRWYWSLSLPVRATCWSTTFIETRDAGIGNCLLARVDDSPNAAAVFR